MTDAPPFLLTVPVDRCLVCGVVGERADGVCSRCGATDADARTVLRVGAEAYGAARAAALAGRFDDAREHLRRAESLGLTDADAWRELAELIAAADPAVAADYAKNYATARSYALEGRFSIGPLLVGQDTPATRELLRLCAAGESLGRRAVWGNVSRYTAVGTVCAVGAFLLFPRAPQTPPARNRSATAIQERRAGVRLRAAKSPPPPDTGEKSDGVRPTPDFPLPTPSPATPYPYPERLARRYYSDARSAFREKRYPVAAELADLAARTGKGTYLLPHALLLRAEIADTMGDDNAAGFWARIAAESPASSYAPLGLLRAAERAKKIFGSQAAVALYLQELMHRYPLSDEARLARRRFPHPLLPRQTKEEAPR